MLPPARQCAVLHGPWDPRSYCGTCEKNEGGPFRFVEVLHLQKKWKECLTSKRGHPPRVQAGARIKNNRTARFPRKSSLAGNGHMGRNLCGLSTWIATAGLFNVVHVKDVKVCQSTELESFLIPLVRHFQATSQWRWGAQRWHNGKLPLGCATKVCQAYPGFVLLTRKSGIMEFSDFEWQFKVQSFVELQCDLWNQCEFSPAKASSTRPVAWVGNTSGVVGFATWHQSWAKAEHGNASSSILTRFINILYTMLHTKYNILQKTSRNIQ